MSCALWLGQVDVEGAEWGVFDSLFEERHLPFGQLLIELHYESTPATFRFFNGMEAQGFRAFSRETNYNPCVLGKLPTAIEYSFIHPGGHKAGRDPAAGGALAALPPYPRQSGECGKAWCTASCLARGGGCQSNDPPLCSTCILVSGVLWSLRR
jgi:hypothetical protein